MANRFVKENELRQIDLGDGDWVKIPARFSFDFVEKFSESQTQGREKVADFVLQIIKEWNLKDDDSVAEINLENVRSLEIPVFKKIVEDVMQSFELPKV